MSGSDQSANGQRPAPVAASVSAAVHAPTFNPTDLLARIWKQSLPLVQDRVAALERAAQQALAEDLAPGARRDAGDVAHKLAGSLGMFGYPKGTEIAREMEQMLDSAEPIDTQHFLQLTVDLRHSLPL